jgi:uncharacterized protein YukE
MDPEQIAALIIAGCDKVEAEVNEAAEVILEGVALFRDMAKMVGRPSVLRAAAAALSSQVETAAKTLSGVATTSALNALDSSSWDSPAADSYESSFNEQTRAIDMIAPVAQDMGNSLNDLADSIEQFFSDLELAYWGFAFAVGGLVLAIVTAVETFGVGAIIGLVISIGGFITGVIGLVNTFTNSSSSNADNATRLLETGQITWPQTAFAQ